MKRKTVFNTARYAVIGVWVISGLLAAPAGTDAKPDLNDRTISEAVVDEYVIDPGVPGYLIDVDTKTGIVTLTGTVDNILAKERAAHIAETVRGVRAVVNRVKVNPGHDRSDDVIKRDVTLALAEDPATDSYEIDVNVASKVVQLGGTVDSWAERELCATVAKGVKGVVDVTNLISVQYKTKRTDSEIRQDIVQRMRWNALLDHGLVDVKVKDGAVTLTGTVGSAAEKREARMDAHVAGVKSVDDSALEVARWARDEDLRKDKYAIKSDDEVRQAIKDALRYDPRVKSFEVEVDVNRGAATLYGRVDNLMAKRAATQDARNTVGVVRVENRIQVKPESTLADAQIKGRILKAIARDPLLGLYEVNVRVAGGVATLHGSVDSAYERSHAEQVVAKVEGVTYVENRLDVQRWDRLPYQPYAYDPFPYDFGWYLPTKRFDYRSDSQLKEEIQDELWWSPYVDEERVTVHVENGKAILTGTVASWSEYIAATNNAFEAGAEIVDNDLVVMENE